MHSRELPITAVIKTQCCGKREMGREGAGARKKERGQTGRAIMNKDTNVFLHIYFPHKCHSTVVEMFVQSQKIHKIYFGHFLHGP